MRILLAASLLAICAACATTSSEPALRGLDPVALSRGEEVVGSAEWTASWGKFTYRFADAASRDTFRTDPERWGIAFGGGCGSMGPLSGVGDPSRFVVHDERIYIFASDKCRDGFLAAPDRFLVHDDPLPGATVESVAQGRALIEKVVAAMGGAERIDALRNCLMRIDKPIEHDGEERIYATSLLVVFPDRIRFDATYGDWQRTDAITGDRGFIRTDGEEWSMARSQVRELQRRFAHHPLAILRARNQPEFFVAALDPDPAHPAAERAMVWFAGTLTTIDVDADSGRIVRAHFRGRDRSGPVGRVVYSFSDYRSVAGVDLPFRVEVTFDGEAQPGSTRTFTAIEVDVESPAFSR